MATLSGTIKVKAPVVLNELAYFPFDETTGTSAVNSVYGRAEAVNFTPTDKRCSPTSIGVACNSCQPQNGTSLL